MPRSRRVAPGLIALAVGLTFVPSRARADDGARPLREAITVEPGATCLETTALVEDVQSWLGADTVDADVLVDVRGSPEEPRVAGFRMLRGGRVVAVRRFEPGPSRCAQLHAVLGLAIAMALKASILEDIAPTVVPAAVPAPFAAPSDVAPEALGRWATEVDALAALAVLPDPAFGIDARIESALTPTLQARLGLLALLAFGETFDAPGHFNTWLLAPRLDLCAGFGVTRRLRAHGCMGMSVGGLHAQGYGFPSPESTFIRWLAVANELGVTAELSRRWSIAANATLILPVSRNSIVLRDYSDSVLQERDLASVGWIFGLGPVFRF
jgi:hypothetical protein